MDTVLGLSLTPSNVGFVLVEGQGADGATVDHDAFHISRRGGASALETSKQAVAAVMRTEATAAAGGHRLHSIGVTWSDGADAEASLLVESLTDSGFDNVVAIRLTAASEALARGIGHVIGYEKTAVCVIEPPAVIVSAVDSGDGTVQTVVSHTLESTEDLIAWLAEIFDRDDWQPAALVVVGSGDDLESLATELTDALTMPVLAPAEAELALARGAALASAQNAEFAGVPAFDGLGHSTNDTEPGRPWWRSHRGAVAMLVAGVLTFVVSLSVAVGLQLAPGKDRNDQRQVADTAGTPAVAPIVVPPVRRPAAQVPAIEPAPPAAPATVEVAPPPLSVPAEPPVADPPVSLPVPAAAPPAAVVTPPEPVVPERQPGVLRRVFGKVPLLGRLADGQPQAPVPPPDEQLPPP